jgi:hypothetical protein
MKLKQTLIIVIYSIATFAATRSWKSIKQGSLKASFDAVGGGYKDGAIKFKTPSLLGSR